MKYRLKYYVISLCRLLMTAGCVFPVSRRRVLLSSDEGSCYSCNPKSIFEAMYRLYGDKFEYVWVLNEASKLPGAFRGKVRTVRFLSLKHVYYLLTSGFVISNLGVEPFLPRRRSQTVISAEHGGGSYKRMYMRQRMFSADEWRYIMRMRKLRGMLTDIVLVSCEKQLHEHAEDYGIAPERFIRSGFPRNDRFFATDESDLQARKGEFRARYGIAAGNLMVLYAPTFRGTHRHRQHSWNDVCVKSVAVSLRRRFGKEVTFLYRRHRHSLPGTDSGFPVVDVTDYPDMQDLLEFADVLITDYSSSIWDFGITLKPAFLYVPDLERFESERGFYTPIEQWPYPYSTTVEELCTLIEGYCREKSIERLGSHQKEIGTFENGGSAQYVAAVINDIFMKTCQ